MMRPQPDTGAVTLLLATLRFPPADGVDAVSLAERWAAADSRGLAELIDFEGCALWLLRRLRQTGAHEVLDSPLGVSVAHAARDIAARNLLIDAETEVVLRFFAARNVPCILLKGAARRALTDRFPFADARPTQDLDVLVPLALAPAVWDDLRAAGYALLHPGRPARPYHHHQPGLLGPAGVAVEIHTSVAPGISAEKTWERIRTTAMTVQRFGAPTLVPSLTELLWDGTMHALRAAARGFRLHQMLAVAAIVAGAGVGGEEGLQEVRTRLERNEGGEAPAAALASAWVEGAAWLAGLGPPAPPASLCRALHWRLALLRHVPMPQRMLTPLADEASRLEFGLPPNRGHTSGFRPVGAALMRNAYRWWRVSHAS